MLKESQTYLASQVIAAMEEWAPSGWAYAWDRTGLNIGRSTREVSRVVTCLTVTDEVVAKVRELGAEMVVSHHPTLWDPLKKIDTSDTVTARCIALAAMDVACYSSHTNLDIAPDGVNDLLADALGLVNRKPLIPAPQTRLVKLLTFVPESHLEQVRTAVCAAGAGVIGEYTECSFSAPGVGTFRPGPGADPYSGEKGELNEEPERRFETLLPQARVGRVVKALFDAHPYETPAYDILPLENIEDTFGLGVSGELEEAMTAEAFAQHVQRALGLEHVLLIGDAQRTVKRVGALGGSGGGEVAKLPRGLDAYVTGDVKYHEAWTAIERNLTVVDAGHYGTERAIVGKMASYLKEKLPELVVTPVEEMNIFQVVKAV